MNIIGFNMHIQRMPDLAGDLVKLTLSASSTLSPLISRLCDRISARCRQKLGRARSRYSSVQRIRMRACAQRGGSS